MENQNNICLQVPWLNSITSTRLRFFYQALSTGQVEWFLGSEIRGSIGKILKSSKGCTKDRNEDCNYCDRKDGCIYIKNFEKHLGNHISKCFHIKIPSSFRSCSGTGFEAGDVLYFDMTVFGHSADEIRKIVEALRANPLRLGSHGLKFNCIESGVVEKNGLFKPFQERDTLNRDIFAGMPVVDLHNINNPQAFIKFEIHTPAEISYKNNQFLQKPELLSFETLVRKMVTRTKNVAEYHFGFNENIESADLTQYLLNGASNIHLVLEKMNARWQRVSLRNKPDGKFGGIIGSFIYKGDIPTPYLELLDAISILGIGKNTTHGFGNCSYQVVTATS